MDRVNIRVIITNTLNKTIKLKFLIKCFALILIYLKKPLHNKYIFVYVFLITRPFMIFKKWQT